MVPTALPGPFRHLIHNLSGGGGNLTLAPPLFFWTGSRRTAKSLLFYGQFDNRGVTQYEWHE